jgi:hypothetical protein
MGSDFCCCQQQQGGIKEKETDFFANAFFVMVFCWF